MFQRIVLLITPSGMCADASEAAVALASRCRARLYVLCVLHEAGHCWDTLFGTPPPKEAEERKAVLEAHFRERLGGGTGCAVETTCGFTEVEAQRFAWRMGADLIVAGWDMEEGKPVSPDRARHLHTLNRLCQGARCPVLVVSRPLGRTPLRFTRILAATDFSRESDHAVRYAAELAQGLEAELRILHVVESPRSLTDEAVDDIRRTLAAHYAKDVAGHPFEAFDVASGEPRQTIVEHALDTEADLIVMAHRRAENSLFEPEVDSVLAYVSQNAACPTLSLNRAAAAR